MKKAKQQINEANIDKLTNMILTESNLEKAEIVLAVKGEIVDKLQRYAEIISNIRIDVMGPLLDRIKAESGIPAADNFNANVAGHLDEVIASIMNAKDKISTETLKLTGDITETTDVADLGATPEELDTDLGMDAPTFDFEDDSNFEELEDETEDVAAKAVEREMKESRKLGLVLESKTGKRGKKFFESAEEMKRWYALNESKIAKVVQILK